MKGWGPLFLFKTWIQSLREQPITIISKTGRSEFRLVLYVPNHPPDFTSKMEGLSGQYRWASLTYADIRIISYE